MEVWLNANRRVLLVGMAVPVLVTLAALATIIASTRQSVQLAAGLALVLSAGILALLIRQLRLPRLASDGKHLLVYGGLRYPTAIPIEIVECFFLGKGPATPHSAAEGPVVQSANVIVRLAQRASEWSERPIAPDVGQWRDSYITLRGAWCEPLDIGRVNALNARLRDVQQASAIHRAAHPPFAPACPSAEVENRP